MKQTAVSVFFSCKKLFLIKIYLKIYFFFLKENFTGEGFFKCRNFEHYLDIKKVCNDIIDCFEGSDEQFCKKQIFLQSKCSVQNQNELNCQNLNENLYNFHIDYKKLKLKNFTEKSEKVVKKIQFQLTYLIIENSMINDINFFQYFPNLFNLIFRKNSVKYLQQTLKMKKLLILNYLDLSQNSIRSLGFLKFLTTKNLIELNLSETKITKILNEDVEFLENLKILILKKCNLRIIQINILQSLTELHLNQTVFSPVQLTDIESKFKNLKYFFSDYFALCCILKQKKSIDKIICKPLISLLKSCKSMMKNSIFIVFFWLMGIIGFFGNIFLLIISTYRNSYEKFNKIYKTFIILFNAILFLHIILLAVANLYFGNNYIKRDYQWRSSLLCGILNILYHSSIAFTQIMFFFLVFRIFYKNYFNLKSPVISIISLIFLINFLLISSCLFRKVLRKKKEFVIF